MKNWILLLGAVSIACAQDPTEVVTIQRYQVVTAVAGNLSCTFTMNNPDPKQGDGQVGLRVECTQLNGVNILIDNAVAVGPNGIKGTVKIPIVPVAEPPTFDRIDWTISKPVATQPYVWAVIVNGVSRSGTF